VNTENRLEIEVKIRVQSLEPLRRKIMRLPAELETGRVFERNVVFDTARKKLRKSGILLRLRQQGARAVLTVKTPGPADSVYKVREETEVEIGDFAHMEKIIRAIGFREFFIYEKYREVFDAQGARIMVDETPIGNFIEIEGDPQRIDAIAAGLGFSRADYNSDSYYQLFLRSGRSGHMVFAE
jgi:adenylate cyclase, class 2